METEAKPQTQTRESLDKLVGNIDELHKFADNLTVRLKPVLSSQPQPQPEIEVEKGDSPNRCDMAQEIHDQTQQIIHIKHILGDLLQYLEL